MRRHESLDGTTTATGNHRLRLLVIFLRGVAQGLLIALRHAIASRSGASGLFGSRMAAWELRQRLRWERAVVEGADPLGEWRAAEQKRWSQYGEDGLIQAFAGALGCGQGFFVEVGAADGQENCTRALAEDGWKGVWFEGTGALATTARDLVGERSLNVTVAQGIVTGSNVDARWRAAGVPEDPDVVVVDIDGDDFWVLRAILRAYRPVLIVAEYNSAFPPGALWVRRPRPGVPWDGTHRHGASLDALTWLMSRAGYDLIGCESSGANAFFGRRDRVAASTIVRLPHPPAMHFRPWDGPYPVLGHPKRRWPHAEILAPADLAAVRVRSARRLDRDDLLGDLVAVEAVVENRSARTLSSGGRTPVRLGGHWLDEEGRIIEHEAGRSVLVREVPPGSTTTAIGVFKRRPEAAALRVRLVQEGVAWVDGHVDVPVS
ncbi:MAG TPA: hypothetical protein VGR26_18685 [Acidimicrobiales bacterium]|nr:hypothetical protein [Acidimicrobiales bacterium]